MSVRTVTFQEGVGEAPFTVLILANPALEEGPGSGHFKRDPIIQNLAAFDGCAHRIVAGLLRTNPVQREPLLSAPGLRGKARVVSLHESSHPVNDAHAFVTEDDASDLLHPRNRQLTAFLTANGILADVVYTVTASTTDRRSATYGARDDTTRPFDVFDLDGAPRRHYHWSLVPGHVAFHVGDSTIAAIHEFGHAMSSDVAGLLVDLYDGSVEGVNCKHGVPLRPGDFGRMDGRTYHTDAGWPVPGVYQCERHSTLPALMGNWAGVFEPLDCEHDRITRDFIHARIKAKMGR